MRTLPGTPRRGLVVYQLLLILLGLALLLWLAVVVIRRQPAPPVEATDSTAIMPAAPIAPAPLDRAAVPR